MLQTQPLKSKPYSVVVMEAWHPMMIDAREFLGVDIDPSWWESLASNGLCRTMLKNGVPFVCAGINPRWQGNAEAWLVIDKNATRMDIGRAGRAVIGFLDEMQIEGRFRRIQTSVDVLDKRATRWAEYIGFTCEGIAKRYDAIGNDHYIYARIR